MNDIHVHTHTAGFSTSGVTDHKQRSCCCESDGGGGGDRTGMEIKETEEHILSLSDCPYC